MTYRDTFLRLADYEIYPRESAARIAAGAGLRNILVHEYNDIDHRILHSAIRTALSDYTRYVTALDTFLG